MPSALTDSMRDGPYTVETDVPAKAPGIRLYLHNDCDT